MSYWLYILRCQDNSLYIGQTTNLERRLSDHAEGVACLTTKLRRPVQLVFAEEFSERAEVLQRERQIKKWSRAKKEALITSDWAEVSALARGLDRRTRSFLQRDGSSPG